jgi:hypothetical protein
MRERERERKTERERERESKREKERETERERERNREMYEFVNSTAIEATRPETHTINTRTATWCNVMCSF